MKLYIVLLGIVGVFSFHLHNTEAAPALLEEQEEIQSLTGIESNEQARTNFEALNDENLSGEIQKIEEIVDANILDESENNNENDSRKTTNQTPTLQEAIQIVKNEVILNRTKNRYNMDMEMNPEISNLERVEPEPELELDDSTNFNTGETPKSENVIHFDSGHLKYLPIVTKSPIYLQNSTTNSTQQQLLLALDDESPSGNFTIESLIEEDLELDNGMKSSNDQNENATLPNNSDSNKTVGVLLVREVEANSIANGTIINYMDEELDLYSDQDVELETDDFNSIPTKKGKKIVSLSSKQVQDRSNTSQHSTTRNTTLSRPLLVGQNNTDEEESIILGLLPIETEIHVGNFKTSSEFSIEYERLSEVEDEYSDRENRTTVEIILPEINLRDDDTNDLDEKIIPEVLQGVQEDEEEEGETGTYSSHPFYFLVGPFTLPNNSRVPSSFFQIQSDSDVFSSAPFIIHLDGAKGRKAEAQTPEDVIQALAEKQAYSIFPRLK